MSVFTITRLGSILFCCICLICLQMLHPTQVVSSWASQTSSTEGDPESIECVSFAPKYVNTFFYQFEYASLFSSEILMNPVIV